MRLADFLDTANPLGTCYVLISGITHLYLVPVGDGFTTYLKDEIISELPYLSKIPVEIPQDWFSAEFKSKKRTGAAGTVYQNSLTFSLSKKVGSWMFDNRERHFWLIFRKGNEWFITGDDAMPYTIADEFASGKSPGEKNGFDVELVSTQLRPYHRYIEAVYTLSGTDWEAITPFAGAWAGVSGDFSVGEYLTYNGSIYQRNNEDVFANTPPDTNADYVEVGPYVVWDRFLDPAFGDYVLHDGSIYQNLTGSNGYSATIPD